MHAVLPRFRVLGVAAVLAVGLAGAPATAPVAGLEAVEATGDDVLGPSDQALGDDDAPAVAAEERFRPDLVIRGSGWGHSVGMSQYGAQAMARAGHGHPDILRHYYTGVDVGSSGALPGDTEIRTHLFARRTIDNPARVFVATASRDGTPPPSVIAVSMSPGAQPVGVPWGQRWNVSYVDGTYFLRDATGGEQARGPGPVLVHIPPPGGAANAALLRLPQLGAEGLAGTFQWGYLRITYADGVLHPVLVQPLELYLRGLAEMPSTWHHEALAAQAITGRTYATRQITSNPGAAWHLGATPFWQAYAGWQKESGPGGANWVGAVDATRARVVTHQGQLAWTYYSSSHGGRSENSEDSWAYAAELPYLRSVVDPWSHDPGVNNPYASWEATVDQPTFLAEVGTQIETVTGVRVLSRTAGGSPRDVEVSGWAADGRRASFVFQGQKGAGAALRNPLGLRSMQIRSFGFPPFSDDDGSVHEYNIALLAKDGITGGCAPERFCPGDPVTRGQMASFLAKAAGLLIDESEPDRFADIADSVHRAAINAVAREGITEGCADGLYCPHDPVTRGQMASFLQRAFGLADADRDYFTDIADSVHRAAVNAVAGAGVTAGCSVDRYCPHDPVTRGQMATFIARALGPGW
jgi:SpoIID/LytB domain protein